MTRAQTIKKQLGFLDSPVEPEKWTRDVILRDAVRQQNLGPTYIQKPGESNLARIAGYLGQFSSTLKQYSDFQFKKGEIAQRGKAITHQELLEQHKLAQSEQSLSQAGIRGGMINETAIQQEIRNETIARQNAEKLQDIYISRLSVEERTKLAIELQEETEVSEERLKQARKRVDDAQGPVPLSKDFFRDERLKMLMGSGLAEDYKDWITKRVNDKLQEIRDGDSTGVIDPEAAKAAVLGLFDEYMQEKNIDPLSDFGKGFLSSVQAFNLDQLGDMANKVVKQTEGVADMQTKLGLIEHGTPPPPTFPEMEALDPHADDYSIAEFEDLEVLNEIVSDLNPRDRTAVARQLSTDGTSLELAMQGGATSRQVRRAIQLAALAKDKDHLAFTEPIIEDTPWFNNLAPRPEETQQQILRSAVRDVKLHPKKNLRLQDTLEKMGTLLEFDRRKFEEHPLYDELMHDLRDGIIKADQAAQDRRRTSLAAASTALTNYAFQYTIDMEPTDLQNLRAELYVAPGGTQLTKERLIGLLEKHGPGLDDSPAALAMLAAIENLDPTGVVDFTNTLQQELLSLADNKKNVEKGWLQFQTWYNTVTSRPVLEGYVRSFTTEAGTLGADATRFIKQFQTRDVLTNTRPEHMGLADHHLRELSAITNKQEEDESALVASLRKQHPDMPAAEFTEVVREALVELQNDFRGKVRDHFVNKRKSVERDEEAMGALEAKALLAHFKKDEAGVALEVWRTLSTTSERPGQAQDILRAFKLTAEGKALSQQIAKESGGTKTSFQFNQMLATEAGQNFFEESFGIIDHIRGFHKGSPQGVFWGGPTSVQTTPPFSVYGPDIKPDEYRDIDYSKVDSYFNALSHGMEGDAEKTKLFLSQHEVWQKQLTELGSSYKRGTKLWKFASGHAERANRDDFQLLWFGDEPDDAAGRLDGHMKEAGKRILTKMAKVVSLPDILNVGLSKDRAAAADGGAGLDYVILSPSHFIPKGADHAKVGFGRLTRDQTVTMPKDYLSNNNPLITGLFKKPEVEGGRGRFLTVEELATELKVPRAHLQLAAEVMGADSPEELLGRQRKHPYYRALLNLHK